MTRSRDVLIIQPNLLGFLAAIGVLGCMSLIFGTLAAQAMVPDHDWISDTISDLAAGRWEIVMDVALYGFAAGLFATSLAAAHAHPGGADWSAGVVSLAILGAIVTVLGARNEYGDNDNEGVVIHRYLVYGLGFFFAFTPLAMSRGVALYAAPARRALRILAGVWIVAAPVFFFLPTDIDGLYERVLGLIGCAIQLVFIIVFIREARALS